MFVYPSTEFITLIDTHYNLDLSNYEDQLEPAIKARLVSSIRPSLSDNSEFRDLVLKIIRSRSQQKSTKIKTVVDKLIKTNVVFDKYDISDLEDMIRDISEDLGYEVIEDKILFE